jgi:hypothetical protein
MTPNRSHEIWVELITLSWRDTNQALLWCGLGQAFEEQLREQ